MNRRVTRSSSRRMREYGYSDERAQDINFEDITSCERNANILRMLRDDDVRNWESRHLYILDEDIEGGCEEFVVAEGDDLGWLGYFVGKCEVLDELIIEYLPERRDKIAFIEGVSQNRSIASIEINCDIGADGWSKLRCIFENNRNLSTLTSKDYEIGYEGALNLEMALEVKENPLKWFHITDADINDEELAVITGTLRFLPELEYLDLHDNLIGATGCVALGNALGRLPASNGIGCLDLNGNAIDDEGVQALVAGAANCSNLTCIYLERNYSITAAGLRSLSPLLQSETASLRCLCLDGINFGDEGMIALVEGLTGNTSLKQLTFDTNAASITSVGWSAFSQLLCDTSTINNTFLSNHTLNLIGSADYDSDLPGIPQDVKRYLKWNKEPWRRQVARCKILYSHPDLDMEPLLRWGSKFIPIVDGWFRNIINFLDDTRLTCIHSYRTYGKLYIEAILRSEHSDSFFESYREMRKSLRSRKLSAMYKFIRNMPDLAVTGYWQHQVNYIILTKKRKLDEAQRRLDEQKQRLKDDEDAAWERLGGAPPGDESHSRNKRIRHE